MLEIKYLDDGHCDDLSYPKRQFLRPALRFEIKFDPQLVVELTGQ